MRLRAALFLAVALAAVAAPRAQVHEPAPLVVMNLAAHPDDEDGATMAYYRHVRNAVVYSVIYTRGEGGQNEIGPDLYERLGALRTAETEAAARVLGTQVYYLNLYDFGFTKWAAEAFSEWSRPRRGFWDLDHPVVGEAAGRDSVTARLVYLIRALKPDVIFTNHDTVTVGLRAQHGHHQAVGLSAWDAFSLAADPTYHPEQLREQGVALWQPQRLFVRTRTPGEADVAVPVAADCGGGESCGDRAVRAAVLHRSQGFDLLAPRFFRRDTTYFTLYQQAAGTSPLPERADDLAAGLPPNPHAAETPLAYLIASGRIRPLTSVAVSDPLHVAGSPVTIRWDPEALPPGAARFRILGADTVSASAAAGHLTLPPAPWKSTGDPRTHWFTWPRHQRQYSRLVSEPPFRYAVEDRAGGVVRAGSLPVEVAPRHAVALEGPLLLRPGRNRIPFQVEVYRPADAHAPDTLLIRASVTRDDDLIGLPFGGSGLLVRPGGDRGTWGDTLDLVLADSLGPGSYHVAVSALLHASPGWSTMEFERAPARVLPPIRVTTGLRVGFVRSYDATTEDALRAMGAEVVPLDSAALAEGRFDGLHTIVLDIRAYLARPDLRAHNDRLLEWVRRGGHLVVGYQKTFEWNPGAPDPTQPEDSGATNPDFAPYPLVLDRDRVVREDAPVAVLDPEHPLFNAPNAITPEDWDGWVQERGLYFPATYDPRYRELLAMSDPGEAPLRGGLLLAEVGAGTYLYSPLVWYRQLEALNAGAWRLFSNLVSLPLTDGRAAPGTR